MQSYKPYPEDKLKHSFPFWNTSKTAELYGRDKLRVVIVGDKESGKSAITTRFIHESFVVKYDPYNKNCYRKRIEVDGKNCTIDVMDSAGQDEFTALKDQYIKTGQIMVVAFSVLSKESFAEVPKWFRSIQRTHNHPFNSEFPYVVLVGNNIDEGEKRVINITESQNLANKYGVPYIEVSTRNGTNIENLFESIVRIHRSNMKSTTATENLDQQTPKPSGLARIFSHHKSKSVKKSELLDMHSEELGTAILKPSSSLYLKA